MPNWHRPSVKLPVDGQRCILMPPDMGGLLTQAIFGPIQWDEKTGAWIDFFRGETAGVLIKPPQVYLWTDWAEIAPRKETQNEKSVSKSKDSRAGRRIKDYQDTRTEDS